MIEKTENKWSMAFLPTQFDIYKESDGECVPLRHEGMLLEEAVGYLAAKEHIWTGKENRPMYVAAPYKERPYRGNWMHLAELHNLSRVHDKNVFYNVCQSWDDYPQLWTVVFRTPFLSSCTWFIYSMAEFDKRERHYCIRDSSFENMLDFLPKA